MQNFPNVHNSIPLPLKSRSGEGTLYKSQRRCPIIIAKLTNVNANKPPMIDDILNDRLCKEIGASEKKTGRGHTHGSENGDGADAGDVEDEMEAIGW
jgi:hypothetical protein